MQPNTTPIHWSTWLACGAATAAALAYLWFGWCVFPLTDWNDVRLAPAFALRHGVTVYASTAGGPLSTWIYGPLTPVLDLPATFAASAVGALQIAGAINLATLLAPLAVVCWTAPGLRDARWPARLIAFALCTLLLPAGSLTFQVADHAAVACGLMACWHVARREAPSPADLALAAGWSVLAATAKQPAILVPLAHVIYLAWFQSRRTAAVYAGWFALFGLVAALVCVASFGFEPLWLNLVQIPARLPWGVASEKFAALRTHLAGYTALPLLAVGAWRATRAWPARATERGRLLRVGALAFAVSLPVGLLAAFKIGGNTNVLHSWYYLLPVGVPALVAAAAVPARRHWLLAATVAAIALRLPEWRSMPAAPLTQRVAEAARLAAVAPGTLWFPNNPVVTFYSDGRIYHVEDGIRTRHLAGLAVRERDFRRHLPAALNAVVYPAGFTAPLALGLLPDYRHATPFRDWVLYERGDTSPAR